MNIIFIASAASIHSLRWIKFFTLKKNYTIDWITLDSPTHQTKNDYNLIKRYANIHICKDFKV